MPGKPPFIVALIFAIFLSGCRRSAEPPGPGETTSSPQATVLSDDTLPAVEVPEPPGDEYEYVPKDPAEDESFGPKELLYVQCGNDEAETILIIRVPVPNVMNERPFRIPLCRQNIRKFGCSRQHLCICADGVSLEGFGMGYTAGIGIDDSTDSSVDVSLSLFWTARDRTHGSFEELLPITVGQPSAKQLDGNVEIRWTFEEPKRVADRETTATPGK